MSLELPAGGIDPQDQSPLAAAARELEEETGYVGTQWRYFGKLSPDSVRSLGLQGGPMSAAEVEAFRRNPMHAEAVRLRRYDEAAKDPRASTPDFDHFLRHVGCCRK